jgi:hypothetical protein
MGAAVRARRGNWRLACGLLNRLSALAGSQEIIMNIKHVAAGLLSIVSLSVFSVAGCATNTAPDEDADAVNDETDAFDEEEVGTADEAITSGTVTCSGAVLSGTINRYTNVVGTDAINNDGAYDVKSICVAEMNKRRRTSHASYGGLTLNAYHVYHASDNSSIVPSYTAASISGAAITTEACQAVADAKKGGHAAYGNPLPGSTGAFCGPTAATAGQAISDCMNTIEAESGFSGHQGGLLWDTARPITCTIGVATVNGVKKKGITINWGTPTTNSGRPNGARCKGASSCTSGVCTDGRCKGAAGSACPAAKSLDCTQHSEDAGLCLQRDVACASGVCKSNNTCQ